MEQIHIQRLERLHALALEIAADEQRRARFNLSGWALEYNPHYSDFFDMASDSDELVHKDDECVVLKEGACGTAACMIGWAGMHPDFNAQGFCLAIRGCYVNPVDHATDRVGWDAVEAFFGLTEKQAYKLFNSNYYKSDTDPLAVAKRIQELLYEVVLPGEQA